MGYAKKKRRIRKISMPKGMRKKGHAKKHEEKKRKRKETNKDSPYFQIKALIQIERVMIQGV
jgi:hypothetical protein